MYNYKMSLQNILVPNDLNLYCKSIIESGSSVSSFVFNLSGPWASPQNCTVYISRQGQTVTLLFNQVVAAASTSATISSNNFLPAQYFPYNSLLVNQLILGESNSVFANCYVDLSNTGGLTIKLADGSNFAGTGNAGFYQFAMTYITV